MNEDTEGFYYPVVDEKKCVNCNLCEKVCPIKKEEKRDQKLWAYATYSKETKIRLQSSSGGMWRFCLASIVVQLSRQKSKTFIMN